MERRRFLTAAATAAGAIAAGPPALAAGATAEPRAQSYDAVIYGATLAGLMAALRLSRRGYTACVLEPTNHIGGVVTGGLVKTDIPNTIGALGGLTRTAFFDAIGAHYGVGSPAQYRFEPKVAKLIAGRLLTESGAAIRKNQRINGPADVTVSGTRIQAVRSSAGWVTARFFIDASYEGDLMAAAGVPYHVGRESSAAYDESYAGFRPHTVLRRGLFEPNTGYPVGPVPGGAEGSADEKVQAYNFRGVLTQAADRLPFPRPDGYDPAHYLHLRSLIDYRGITGLTQMVGTTAAIPGAKHQTNQGLFIGYDLPGVNWEYPDGTWARREEIIQQQVRWHQGMQYWLSHDPSLPASFRADAATWGLPADEFVDSPHGAGFPHQLYIREGRRMKGAHVLTQHDLFAPNNTKATSVACWQYGLDCHTVQLYPDGDRYLIGEGSLTGEEGNVRVDLYQLPAECLFPSSGSIDNLTVPVCFSSSHVAYLSPRMEPNYGMLGEAAGELAAQAIARDTAVQAYRYADLATALREFGSVLSV
ncbi:FAD-dependent oxidoreductase [Streptomyces sp. SBT349]|uniref:FAD-dependent oxidoreductase n=1 Tax=Streptomyces sp. SBT349 TaxID=1580539 RepID=UPI00066A85A9|nr:FAD-dependent oxidoreductase [Streptomyces sp. SBT349]